MPSELTGVDVTSIPIPDPKVMSLLETTEAQDLILVLLMLVLLRLDYLSLERIWQEALFTEAHPTHF